MINLDGAGLTVILGASGSGSSALARTIYDENPGVAIVSSDAYDHVTFLRDTVIEEVAFGLEQRGIAPEVMLEKCNSILTILGLIEHKESDPHTLSGGQTRRLALATVAILDEPVLILDDPFGGLDIESIAHVTALIEQQSKEHRVIVLINDGEMAKDLLASAEQVFYMSDGQLGKEPFPVEELTLPLPVVVQEDLPIIDLGVRRGERKPAPRKWWQFRTQKGQHFETEPISIQLQPGTVMWLRGQNGAGKTTLLRSMVGFDNAEPLSQSVTMQTQRAEDQVTTSTMASFVDDPQVLEELGIDPQMHPMDAPRAQLRLAQLAAVFGQKTDIVLLDEPNVGVDLSHREQFHHILHSGLNAGQAIIMTCHDPVVMEEICSYADVIEKELPSGTKH